MKKILIPIFILFVTIGFAQDKKDSKDAVLTEITKEVCECVGEKNVEGLSPEDVEIQLGLCMMKSYGKYKDRLDKYMSVSLDDPSSLELLGQEIGFRMLETCPDTFMSFAKDLIEDEMKEQLNTPTTTTVTKTSISGEVVKLTKDQFNVLTFKGDNKRVYKLLWLEYFEGQELLSDIKNIKKSTLKVSYEDKEMYDPKLQDYRTYKILRKLEVVK